MKAVVLTAYCDVDRLDFRDVPDPQTGANEIKIRMAGSSINPVDWKLRSGSLAAMGTSSTCATWSSSFLVLPGSILSSMGCPSRSTRATASGFAA